MAGPKYKSDWFKWKFVLLGLSFTFFVCRIGFDILSFKYFEIWIPESKSVCKKTHMYHATTVSLTREDANKSTAQMPNVI